MDPHANIVEAVSLATAFVKHPFPPAEDVARLGELVIALHEWRTNGGFDPYLAPDAPVADPQANALLAVAKRWRSVRVFTTPGVASLPDGYVYVCEHANPPTIECGIAPDGSVSS